MFNYKAKFPLSLVKSTTNFYVNHVSNLISYDPDDPTIVLQFTDEWEEWKLNISNIYYIDYKTLTIIFNTKDDYTMFVLRWS